MDMLDPTTIHFIEKYILKSGEQLDLTNTTNSDSPFVDVKIIKRTERTLRVVGLLTLSSDVPNIEGESPDEELQKINFTPRKKVQFDDHHPTTLQWLEQGWIIKEIRFKKDEKTIESMCYRMGYRLHKYQEYQIQQKKNAIDQEFRDWKERAASLELKDEQQISHQRQKGVKSLINLINEICRQDIQELEDSPLIPSKWPMQKRLKFLHFVLAFLQLCLRKADFDWKEIGANYFKEIGGSKEFDSNKEEFIAQLEEWAECPAALLGLTSLGKITPLYFSGQIAGRFSSYYYGPVHALTDLSISEDEYSTNAATLWLVENRAVLTRMAAEKEFMKETNSLVVCVDGHLRSSHKRFIHQLLKNSSIQQIIIWSDYDPDGLQIAKELYMAVSQHDTPDMKWITHDHDVMTNWQQYEDYIMAFLKHQKAEQEQVLGGVEDWKKWIGH
jgi:5S rRNA maturation endonuclease (ribonuclease M5)